MRRLIACCFAISMSAAAAVAQTAPVAPPAPATPRVAPTPPTAPVAPARLEWRRYLRASEIRLENMAAYVRVRPEERDDVAVAIVNQGPLPAPNLRRSGRRLVIDGRLRGQLLTCTVRGATGFDVRTRRQGQVSGGQLPVIEIRVPLEAVVTARGAMRMHMTAAESAEVSFDGCGDADIERVDDLAQVAVAGDAKMRIFDAGELVAALAGEAQLEARYVRDGATVSIAGAGVFRAARADGPTNIVIQGAGEAAIGEGRAEDMTVVINGAGEVIHNGSAESLDVFIVGAGDVRVREVEGEVSRRVLGAGRVVVGR